MLAKQAAVQVECNKYIICAPYEICDQVAMFCALVHIHGYVSMHPRPPPPKLQRHNDVYAVKRIRRGLLVEPNQG